MQIASQLDRFLVSKSHIQNIQNLKAQVFPIASFNH